jgi:hypothetical protein
VNEASKKIKINRAPVLTLWATVVAERLGYDHETALTLGKAVAGLNAQSKGRRLGIYGEKSEEEREADREQEASLDVEYVELLGRTIPALRTPEGLRAAIKGEVTHPASVEKYLKQKFKDDLDATRSAMEKLAAAYPPADLEPRAFGLYERFRPKIPEGAQGWGAAGELDLDFIASLAG